MNMNMSEHTKEPWRLRGYDIDDDVTGDSFIYDGYGDLVCIVQWAPDPQDNAEAKANARRIVACVNACAGMPTEELEIIGDAGGLKCNQIADLLATQCDLTITTSPGGRANITCGSKQMEAARAQQYAELLEIHTILMCPAECPPVADTDTLTIRLLKDVIHDWHANTKLGG